jgi:antitoxin YefM
MLTFVSQADFPARLSRTRKFSFILDKAQTLYVVRVKNMISGIKHKALVGKNGKIEIPSSELPEGISVEVIILVESQAEDETNYLLSMPANREHLLQAIDSIKSPDNLVMISPDEWNEKYRV